MGARGAQSGLRLIVLLVGGACAHQALQPALFSPQLASDQLLVTGTVLALTPDSAGLYVVVVVAPNRTYRLLLPASASGPRVLQTGSIVTAWCRGAGTDLVADSIRVDHP